jgi:WD40 repeat protein
LRYDSGEQEKIIADASYSERRQSARPALAGLLFGGGVVLVAGIVLTVLYFIGVFSDEDNGRPKPVGPEAKGPKIERPKTANPRIVDGPATVPVLYVREPRVTLPGDFDPVRSLAISPDGRTLAVAKFRGTIQLWDLTLTPPQQRTPLTGHQGAINVLAFSPDNKILAAAGSDRIVHLWNMETTERRKVAGLESDVHTLAFSPGGMTIAGGCLVREEVGGRLSCRAQVKLWDIRSGEELVSFSGQEHFRFDGTVVLAFANDRALAMVDDYNLSIWELPAGRRTYIRQSHPFGNRALAVTSDGTLLATGGNDRIVKFWNAAAGTDVVTLTGQASIVGRLAFSKDGTLLAAATGDILGADVAARADETRLWEVAGRQVRAVLQGPRDSMMTMAFHFDGTTVITGGLDGTIRLWDVPAPGNKVPVVPTAPAVTDRAIELVVKHGGRIRREGSEIVSIDLPPSPKVADDDFDVLKDLKRLRELKLDSTEIGDAALQRLHGCSQLEELSVVGTRVTEAGASAFKKAVQGCWIRFSVDDLENAMVNQKQNLLLAIRACGGRIQWAPGGDFVSVNLGGNPRIRITDAGLRHLKGLTKLKVLEFYRELVGVAVTDAGLEQLRGLEALEHLGIAFAEITNDGLIYLKKLSNLKYLDLRGTLVTDAGLQHLEDLRNLQALHLGGSRVTTAGVRSLQKRLPRCQISLK